jgi:23S rRNA pseudouridine955/2504/2580 synthase
VTVVYEDENFAVLYKPAHLLCHSDRTGDANLVDAFAAYLETKGEYDPHAEKRFAPALCNRLDRGTEGLVLAAKSYAALRDLNAIIRDDMMKKEYLTITVGAPPQGRFVAWLQHSEKNNKVRIHARESEGYKQIITEVTVIRQAGPFALCRIGLITGRTHQIRAHLAYLGHPVLGDIKYGNHKMNERTGLKTQALCAQRMTFGRIPEENTLHYLSGRVIKLNDPEIVKTFERLAAEK